MNDFANPISANRKENNLKTQHAQTWSIFWHFLIIYFCVFYVTIFHQNHVFFKNTNWSARLFKSFFVKTKNEGNNTFFENQSSQNAEWRRCFYPNGQIERFYHPFFRFRQIRLGLNQTAFLKISFFFSENITKFFSKKSG